jgi:hypothetical protein
LKMVSRQADARETMEREQSGEKWNV